MNEETTITECEAQWPGRVIWLKNQVIPSCDAAALNQMAQELLGMAAEEYANLEIEDFSGILPAVPAEKLPLPQDTHGQLLDRICAEQKIFRSSEQAGQVDEGTTVKEKFSERLDTLAYYLKWNPNPTSEEKLETIVYTILNKVQACIHHIEEQLGYSRPVTPLEVELNHFIQRYQSELSV